MTCYLYECVLYLLQYVAKIIISGLAAEKKVSLLLEMFQCISCFCLPSYVSRDLYLNLRRWAFLTFILQKLASIFSCSTSFLAWPTLMVLFTGVSPFILATNTATFKLLGFEPDRNTHSVFFAIFFSFTSLMEFVFLYPCFSRNDWSTALWLRNTVLSFVEMYFLRYINNVNRLQKVVILMFISYSHWWFVL